MTSVEPIPQAAADAGYEILFILGGTLPRE
jgi:hypothetical protein